MYTVDLYLRVRLACHVDGLSQREAASRFGIAPIGRPPVEADMERKVRVLCAEKWGVNRIARELGIGSGTVRRIVYD